ncbi:hypothetical protein [uncultured Methanobrevibacter sp.]|uniref:hypothetical protein n=1 Tax=uncultured Methanobrevibacter sp. TaxID=253161 RepID=UPI0025D152E9|nr:hypothetical protein [uncultured Methanobrevibacter sp.]
MGTGLYRVYKIDYFEDKPIRWSYRVHNKLVKKEIYDKDLLNLKKRVLDAGFLWGIVDVENALKTADEMGCNIKELEGRYGVKIKE